jgi:hypothetical protein
MRLAVDVVSLCFVLHTRGTKHLLDVSADQLRTYAALNIKQLQQLYLNMTGQSLATTDYNATLQACRGLARRILDTETERSYLVHDDEDEERG